MLNHGARVDLGTSHYKYRCIFDLRIHSYISGADIFDKNAQRVPANNNDRSASRVGGQCPRSNDPTAPNPDDSCGDIDMADDTDGTNTLLSPGKARRAASDNAEIGTQTAATTAAPPLSLRDISFSIPVPSRTEVCARLEKAPEWIKTATTAFEKLAKRCESWRMLVAFWVKYEELHKFPKASVRPFPAITLQLKLITFVFVFRTVVFGYLRTTSPRRRLHGSKANKSINRTFCGPFRTQ